MKIVYASRTGNVEKMMSAFNEDKVKIVNGEEQVNEDFVLFTYTDGAGIVPAVVEKFLESNHGHLKAVVASGNSQRHAATFCFAGDKIAEKYHVECLAKVEGAGSEAEIAAIKEKMAAL